MVNKYIRGSIWWASLPHTLGSSVQSGLRPCIIISNNTNNVHSPTVNIIPCTTQKDSLPIHPSFSFRSRTNYAMCEQIRTIDVKDLQDYSGCIDNTTMGKIETALKQQLNLIPAEFKDIEVTLLSLESILDKYDKDILAQSNEYKNQTDSINSHMSTIINRVSKYAGMTATEKFKARYNLNDKKESGTSKKSNPRRKWTEEKITELLNDSKNLSIEEIIKKWDFNSRKSAQTFISNFRKRREADGKTI